MVTAARWLLVLALATVLVATPVAVRAWPVQDSDLDAAALVEAIRASEDVAWSGEVRTQGSLEVPESDSAFDGVARLLGESSQLRVWWRSPERYRVDRLRESGETDLLRLGAMTLRWRYEGNQVTLTRASGVRLPDDPDLVPAALADRMLDGAAPDELRRLPAERIAGRTALGLLLEPSDVRTTVDRVLIWADEESGLPLRVEVYADGGSGVTAGDTAVVASEVERLDLGQPESDVLTFRVPPGADVGRGRDLADAADEASPFLPPEELAGLPRTDRGSGAAAVYGSGPTSLAVIPISDRVGEGLREELQRLGDVTRDGRSTAAELGPLSVKVFSLGGFTWLLVGTVTPATLDRATSGVATGVGDGLVR